MQGAPILIVDKPAVCQRDFPIACLRTASRASTASNRDENVFFSANARHLLPKNTRNDVHAVISD